MIKIIVVIGNKVRIVFNYDALRTIINMFVIWW